MRFVPRSLWCCVCMACIAPRPACADEPALLQRVGPAALRTMSAIENDPIVLAFTDVLALVVEVEGDAGLEVRPPDPWIKGPWQARPADASQRKEIGQKVVWRQTLNLEPLQPGELSMVVEPLRYRNVNGDWQTVTWKPIPVRVTSRLTQPDVKSARDITAIEELPAQPAPESHTGLIVTGFIGAAVLAMVLVAWLRRRQTVRARRTPEAWALYELQRLQALHLPEHGKHERFGTLLTGLARRYLERRFEFPARRQTTGEFLAALAGHEDLASHRAFLESFLRRCDLIKFAPVTSSADECRALAEQVRQFISQQQQQPAPSGPAGAS